MTRKYDVAEIDRMRAAVARLLVNSGATNAEDHLRTYMVNGTDPEELEKYADVVEARKRADMEVARAERVLKQHTCQHKWVTDARFIIGSAKPQQHCNKCDSWRDEPAK